jgi:hypothetical protein
LATAFGALSRDLSEESVAHLVPDRRALPGDFVRFVGDTQPGFAIDCEVRRLPLRSWRLESDESAPALGSTVCEQPTLPA